MKARPYTNQSEELRVRKKEKKKGLRVRNTAAIFGLTCIARRGRFLGNIAIYTEDNLKEMSWYPTPEPRFREEVSLRKRFHPNNYVDVVLTYDLDRGGELLFGLRHGL